MSYCPTCREPMTVLFNQFHCFADHTVKAQDFFEHIEGHKVLVVRKTEDKPANWKYAWFAYVDPARASDLAKRLSIPTHRWVNSANCASGTTYNRGSYDKLADGDHVYLYILE